LFRPINADVRVSDRWIFDVKGMAEAVTAVQPKEPLAWHAWVSGLCWCTGAAILLAVGFCQLKALDNSSSRQTEASSAAIAKVTAKSSHTMSGAPVVTALQTNPFAKSGTRAAQVDAGSVRTPPAVAPQPKKAPVAAASVAGASTFIETSGPQGMRVWSDGKTVIYIRDGKMVACRAAGGTESVAGPPPGTPLYGANGRLVGQIVPGGARLIADQQPKQPSQAGTSPTTQAGTGRSVRIGSASAPARRDSDQGQIASRSTASKSVRIGVSLAN
jgi:hypothetical protein